MITKRKMVYHNLLLVFFVLTNIPVLMAVGENGKNVVDQVNNPKNQEEKRDEAMEADIQTLKNGLIEKAISTFKSEGGLDAGQIQLLVLSYHLSKASLVYKVGILSVTGEFMNAKGWKNCEDVINGLTEATTIRFSDVKERLQGSSGDSLKTLEDIFDNEIKKALKKSYSYEFSNHCKKAKIPMNPMEEDIQTLKKGLIEIVISTFNTKGGLDAVQ
ncbi:uncharacterized protein LOC128995861 isoform X2 [Macrosteles quadrilineatus]|uniref:uncharacterized protein LOC128995861 isoform X2 n=1 Tax=Macrosteles quadrilineatus TaxID=74068 RepID=UPI0023E1EF55|nr:uncharacterized protein LOC128995861 isoform X2 [Macrosteles quadrilineatus]